MTTGTSQASTSSSSLAYKEESAYGVVADGAPKALRNTGESLGYSFTQSESTEINSTAQVSDAIITDASASGGINFEAQYHEYDTFVEALLRNTYSEFGTGGVKSLTVTFSVSAGTITGTTGDFTGLVAGQWFSVKDSDATDNNDGYYLISSVTSSVITVDTETPLLADKAADAGVSISSTRITNGTAAMRTFSIEKSFGDVNQFFMHKGRGISSMSLNFATGSILTGSFNTMGKNATRADATQFSTSASAAEAYGIASCVTGVGNILVRNAAGASILGGAYIQAATINIDGKLREQKAVGNLGAVGLGAGTFSMTGTLEIYLKTGSIYDAALAGQLISVALPVKDSAGNGYAYTFANVKLNVPDVMAGSKDQDVLMSVPFTAVAPNTTTDRMIAIDRFGASVVAAT
jgi:hypothetical protein